MRLFDTITRLVDHGNTFSGVQSVLSTSLLDSFLRIMIKFNLNDRPAIETIFKHLSPSDGFIRKCFVHSYIRNKNTFDQEMENINFEYLSCDHTFKTATNIGYLRNKKWVKLHDSVFLVLNEIGQVTGYKFSMGKSFIQLSELFDNLKDRNPGVRNIYVDNCCNWRKKIQEVFPDVEVITPL